MQLAEQQLAIVVRVHSPGLKALTDLSTEHLSTVSAASAVSGTKHSGSSTARYSDIEMPVECFHTCKATRSLEIAILRIHFRPDQITYAPGRSFSGVVTS